MSTPMHGPRHYVNLVIDMLEREHLTPDEAAQVLMIALRAVLAVEHRTPTHIDEAMLYLASLHHESEAKALKARTAN